MNPSPGNVTEPRDPEQASIEGLGIRPNSRNIASRAAMCWRCWFADPVVVARSAKVALVVGTVLALLNQGDVLFAGPPWPNLLWPKLALTYCVPFAVATYGALANGKPCPHGNQPPTRSRESA